MTKKKRKVKWDLKIAIIVILSLLLIDAFGRYADLKDNFKDYQNEIEKAFLELEVNLTQAYADMDCYERGTAYCYDEPQITHSCEEGYSLACVKD